MDGLYWPIHIIVLYGPRFLCCLGGFNGIGVFIILAGFLIGQDNSKRTHKLVVVVLIVGFALWIIGFLVAWAIGVLGVSSCKGFC
ncbi:hypothetical protein ACFLXI_05525 [Chloroflexota bacterium]